MKKSLTIISVIAETMQSDSYAFYEKQTISGEDVLLTNTHELNGQQVVKEKDYQISVPVFNQVNHKRRLKRAYESDGLEGLMNYCKKYLKEERVKELEGLIKKYLK
jgi:hypothetical protein